MCEVTDCKYIRIQQLEKDRELIYDLKEEGLLFSRRFERIFGNFT